MSRAKSPSHGVFQICTYFHINNVSGFHAFLGISVRFLGFQRGRPLWNPYFCMKPQFLRDLKKREIQILGKPQERPLAVILKLKVQKFGQCTVNCHANCVSTSQTWVGHRVAPRIHGRVVVEPLAPYADWAAEVEIWVLWVGPLEAEGYGPGQAVPPLNQPRKRCRPSWAESFRVVVGRARTGHVFAVHINPNGVLVVRVKWQRQPFNYPRVVTNSILFCLAFSQLMDALQWTPGGLCGNESFHKRENLRVSPIHKVTVRLPCTVKRCIYNNPNTF